MKRTYLVDIVTDTSKGLGAETVRLLAQKGWNVVINYSQSEYANR